MRLTSPCAVAAAQWRPLLWGDTDAMIPIANAQDYVRALPQSTIQRLEGLGHVPREESPERSLATALDFLRN